MEDYKVKDLSQAEFGRKEISIAESESSPLCHGRRPTLDFLREVLDC